ncbi:hypothetical protein VM98_35850, partial [Streptomyces rubellomurinus subsp. indigoferus]
RRFGGEVELLAAQGRQGLGRSGRSAGADADPDRRGPRRQDQLVRLTPPSPLAPPAPVTLARRGGARPNLAPRREGLRGGSRGGDGEPYQLVLPPGAAAVGIRVGACGPAGPAEAL